LKKLKELLDRVEVDDVGLVLVAIGLALWDLSAALIAVGVILILHVRPLRRWF
jgi:hypothetical protein